MRIHIFGASGSGVTSLGRVLSDHLNISVFDFDDYYWEKTDPPYTSKVGIQVRDKKLTQRLEKSKNWILSGSLDQCSDVYLKYFSLVVFLYVPKEIRIERLKEREKKRYGERILAGGDLEKQHREFMEWASQYEEGHLPGRSFKRHKEWMSTIKCPVLKVDGGLPLEMSKELILESIVKH